MTQMMKWIGVTMVTGAALVACGGETGGGGGPPGPARTFRAEVRLRGVTPTGGFHAALVDVKDFAVTAPDGTPLVTHPGQRNIDLARTAHAWLLGSADVPETLDHVRVAVKLDDYGGWEGKAGAGHVDARHTTIRFDAPVKWLTQRHMATVALDLDASLVDRGGERRVMVPQLRVDY